MARGGARTGAGRPRKDSNVVGFPGGASIGGSAAPPAPPSDETRALVDPPGDLPDPQQLHWRALAPLAIEQRTLVPATAPGFRELCQLLAFKEELARDMAKFGTGGTRLKEYTKLSPRVDAALARFKLTAFGKPADGAKHGKPAMNPFAQLMKG
jgi:hypothetical protein